MCAGDFAGSVYRYLFVFLFPFPGFWDPDFKDTILKVGLDLVHIDVYGHFKSPTERTERSLISVIVLAFYLFFLFSSHLISSEHSL